MDIIGPMIEFLRTLFEGQIGVPLQNPLSIVYVIVNAILLLFTTFFAGA